METESTVPSSPVLQALGSRRRMPPVAWLAALLRGRPPIGQPCGDVITRTERALRTEASTPRARPPYFHPHLTCTEDNPLRKLS